MALLPPGRAWAALTTSKSPSPGELRLTAAQRFPGLRWHLLPAALCQLWGHTAGAPSSSTGQLVGNRSAPSRNHTPPSPHFWHSYILPSTQLGKPLARSAATAVKAQGPAGTPRTPYALGAQGTLDPPKGAVSSCPVPQAMETFPGKQEKEQEEGRPARSLALPQARIPSADSQDRRDFGKGGGGTRQGRLGQSGWMGDVR